MKAEHHVPLFLFNKINVLAHVLPRIELKTGTESSRFSASRMIHQ